MKVPRRKFLHLAAGAAALPAVSRVAWAEAIRHARCISSLASHRAAAPTSLRVYWGSGCRYGSVTRSSFENWPGAGTNIATEAVVNSPPDGYTLLLITSANFINATLYEKLNFNFIRDRAKLRCSAANPP